MKKLIIMGSILGVLAGVSLILLLREEKPKDFLKMTDEEILGCINYG